MADAPARTEIALQVLGYREGDEWVALALEMDLRGWGKTKEEALEDLLDHVVMQISFAQHKDDPSLLWHFAEPQYWSIYQEGRRAAIIAASSLNRQEGEADYYVDGLPFPSPEVIEKAVRESRFANAP